MVVFGVSHGMLGESCTMMSESDQTKTSKRIREVPAGHQGSGCVGCPRAPRALALEARRRHDNIIYSYNDSSVTENDSSVTQNTQVTQTDLQALTHFWAPSRYTYLTQCRCKSVLHGAAKQLTQVTQSNSGYTLHV
jgi:hypothetical protein